jgi:hypothetical protein
MPNLIFLFRQTMIILMLASFASSSLRGAVAGDDQRTNSCQCDQIVDSIAAQEGHDDQRE